MVWLFERQGRTARLETLYLAADNYELRFVDADGAERVERFTNTDDLGERQKEIQQSLTTQGWERTGGWKL